MAGREEKGGADGLGESGREGSRLAWKKKHKARGGQQLRKKDCLRSEEGRRDRAGRAAGRSESCQVLPNMLLVGWLSYGCGCLFGNERGAG